MRKRERERDGRLSIHFTHTEAYPLEACNLTVEDLILTRFFRRRFVSVSSSLVRAGEWFSGEDAVSLGLANELVAPEELMPRALELAVALTEKQQAAL